MRYAYVHNFPLKSVLNSLCAMCHQALNEELAKLGASMAGDATELKSRMFAPRAAAAPATSSGDNKDAAAFLVALGKSAGTFCGLGGGCVSRVARLFVGVVVHLAQ